MIDMALIDFIKAATRSRASWLFDVEIVIKELKPRQVKKAAVDLLCVRVILLRSHRASFSSIEIPFRHLRANGMYMSERR